jgi:hypothetical protein
MRNHVVFFHPFHRHLGPVARTWRRPFPSCGVASPQHQLLIVNRFWQRSSNLPSLDRILADLLALLVRPTRLLRSAVVLRSSRRAEVGKNSLVPICTKFISTAVSSLLTSLLGNNAHINVKWLVCRFAYRIGQLEAKRNFRAAPDLSGAKDIEVVMREVKTVLQARLELAASRQMTSPLTGALFLVKRRACNRLRLSQRVETE